MRTHLIRILSTSSILALFLTASCTTQHDRGSSSIEMLEPFGVQQATSKMTPVASGDVVVNDIPPAPKGALALPVYPPQALAAHAGMCTVFVTITIDPLGVVIDVSPSWNRLNIPGKFSDDFLLAVKNAVNTWRFEPARHMYWKKTSGEDLVYLRTEVVPAMTDVKFTFEATGRVR